MSGGLTQPDSAARLASSADTSKVRPAKAALYPTDFLMIVALAVILRLPYLSLAVFGDPDEESFILAARQVLLGHLPYTTYWDHRPLGSTVLMAASMAVFGQSVEVIRLLGMVCVIATASLLYLITRRIFPENRIPLVAALLYVAFTVALPGTSTMNEILLAPFTAAGVLLLARAPERNTAVALLLAFGAAGLAFGIATWIKYVPAIPAAVTACVALLAVCLQPRFGLARAVGAGTVFVAGLVLPTVISIAFYAWVGALDVFLGANFGFASHYIGDLPDHPYGTIFYAIRCLTIVIQDAWPLLLTAAAAFLPAARRHLFAPEQAYLGRLMVAWLIGEMLSVTAETKFYVYHYLLTLPPLCVLSAVAVGVYSNIFARPSKVALVTILAAGFMIIGPAVVHLRAVAADRSRGDVPRAVSRAILSDAKPGDGLFIPNYEAIIYFLTKLPLPTPYADPNLLIGGHASLIPDDPHAEVQRILDTRPKYIVIDQSWRDSGVYWDPAMMTFVETTLSRYYAERESWVLPEANTSVALFIRSE